ncbi:MAG TPA: hybrid sensor histidine kinase/response regulator [Pelagibacterium sp.]|uniref:hybrid sensor histidine kinase/response regulator n=1 Tax=Pelagibacterium sp. TaxID=1967288 RepID=UPI002C5E119E|nr:hybrid sensor histidine kinase/response regulator [Pelagibacterium sp.]HWJ89010.1 hybrid sensor histidine kinase/response regulator [Pelagibacterium sp.]
MATHPYSTLNSSDASLAAAIDHLPYGIAVFDARLDLVVANAPYRAGLALPASLVTPGTPLDEILLFMAQRGDLGPGTSQVLADQRRRLITAEAITLTQRTNFTGVQLEIHTSRRPDGGLVVSFSDVTDRAKAEAALEQVNHTLEERVNDRTRALTLLNAELEQARSKADEANHEKTRFLAAASHDLLQPLNAARLYTSTLYERTRGTPAADLASSIDASLNAVEEIMSTLLDISRMDSGALKVTRTVIDILDLLKKIEIEFQPLASEKSIDLRVVGASFMVRSDRMLLARVIQNLVSNAIKYTRPGGRVLVGCRRHGGTVRLDVIDTGIGIDHHQHEVIFAEFSRLEQGARIAPGLGLGLSIVQRILTALDHPMEIESVVGKGSRFSITVPLVSAAAPAPVADEAAISRTAAQFDGLHVLCVDNERSILDAMSGLLENWGCDVRTATSLKEIAQLGMLEGWVPDLVLMDYHLDQTSGLDAIEWLKQIVGGHLPTILVTADRTPSVRQLAETRGTAVLNKPVKPAALRALLTQMSKRL